MPATVAPDYRPEPRANDAKQEGFRSVTWFYRNRPPTTSTPGESVLGPPGICRRRPPLSGGQDSVHSLDIGYTGLLPERFRDHSRDDPRIETGRRGARPSRCLMSRPAESVLSPPRPKHRDIVDRSATRSPAQC